MKLLVLTGIAFATVLSACGGSVPGPAQKSEGPAVGSLTQAQIEDFDSQCFTKFGSVDDPRVPYSQNYCRLVEVERNRRAMTVPKAEQDKNRSLLNLGKGTPQPAGGPGQ